MLYLFTGSGRYIDRQSIVDRGPVCDERSMRNIHFSQCTESVGLANKTDYSPVAGMESGKWVESSECRTAGTSSAAESPMSHTPCEPLKWVFLSVFLVLAGSSNWAVLAYTHDFVPRQPLPDIIFSLVPQQDWATRSGDLMVTCCLVCFILLTIFHASRVIIVRRVLFVVGTLYAMRSCTLLVTQLPPGYVDNNYYCRKQVNSSSSIFFSRLFEQWIRLGFQGHANLLCGDLLFSGHTLVMVTCSLFFAYYVPLRMRVLRFVPYCFAAFGMTCMVISRTHYTIDIIIAFWLTNYVFRIYHAYCEVDVYMDRKNSVLHGLLICKVISWLEEKIVPGKIENQFSIPFYEFLRTKILNRAPGHHKQISISSSSTFNLP